MIYLEVLSIRVIPEEKASFMDSLTSKKSSKQRENKSRLWVKSLVFFEEGGRKIECPAIESQFDQENNAQQDDHRAVCELDTDTLPNSYSAIVSVKPMRAISSIELVLDITPLALEFELANIKIVDPAYPLHPLLFSASFKHPSVSNPLTPHMTQSAPKIMKSVVCTLGIRCASVDQSESFADCSNEESLSEFVNHTHDMLIESRDVSDRVMYKKDFVEKYCTSFAMECGQRKEDLNPNHAYYIVEGSLILTVTKSSIDNKKPSLAYKIYRVPSGQYLFYNSEMPFQISSIEALERCRIIKIEMPKDSKHRKDFFCWDKFPQVTSAIGELFTESSKIQEFSLSIAFRSQDSKNKTVLESAHHLKLISNSRLEQEMTFDVSNFQQDAGNLFLQVDLWRKFEKTTRSQFAVAPGPDLTHTYTFEFHGNFTGSVRIRVFGNEVSGRGNIVHFVEFPFPSTDSIQRMSEGLVEIGKCLELRGKFGNDKWLGDTLSLHLQVIEGSGSIGRFTLHLSKCLMHFCLV